MNNEFINIISYLHSDFRSGSENGIPRFFFFYLPLFPLFIYFYSRIYFYLSFVNLYLFYYSSRSRKCFICLNYLGINLTNCLFLFFSLSGYIFTFSITGIIRMFVIFCYFVMKLVEIRFVVFFYRYKELSVYERESSLSIRFTEKNKFSDLSIKFQKSVSLRSDSTKVTI